MRHLLRALARSPDPLSDAALLARYAADRDPAAFEVLVWRHGGLVLGVCRRRLRDAHAAEDAFQATFLILSRQASRVRADTLPGFLHRVARRVAGRAALKHHRRREAPLVADPAAKPTADPELAAVLDAEIDRLPDRLRQVVVLCYLDGQSTEAAAARLSIPRGTVLSRLHTARAKLRDRLTRRGVTPPAVGLTLVLTAEQVAGGVRAAGGGVGAATILANEVLTMSARKLIIGVAAGLILVGGAGTGIGVLNAQSGGSPNPPPAGSVPLERPEVTSDRTRHELIDRLAKASAQVGKQLEQIQGHSEAIRLEGADQLDPAALRAALVRLDEQILHILYPPTDPTPPHSPEPRPDLDNLSENELWRLSAILPELQPLRSALDKAVAANDKVPDSDSAAKAAAKSILDEAVGRLREAIKPNRDKIIQQTREYWARNDAHKDKLEAAEQRERRRRAAVVEKRRADLVRLTVQAERRATQLRRLANEEQMLSDIRSVIERQRLAVELGITLPPAKP